MYAVLIQCVPLPIRFFLGAELYLNNLLSFCGIHAYIKSAGDINSWSPTGNGYITVGLNTGVATSGSVV